jgi:hypothetical protein
VTFYAEKSGNVVPLHAIRSTITVIGCVLQEEENGLAFVFCIAQ